MRKSSSRFEGAGQGEEVQGVTCSDIHGVSACEEGHVVGSEAKFSCDVRSRVPTQAQSTFFFCIFFPTFILKLVFLIFITESLTI